jgi:glycine/D-amino acid oxidase-like deaminating enzyme
LPFKILETDILIVGQGLAGTCLAFRLIQKGYRPMVIDQPAISSSSRVAAGMMNPLVFRYLTLSWKAIQALPLAKIFYHEMEAFLKSKFLYDIPVAKLFSETDADLWSRKALLAGFDNFTDGQTHFPFSNDAIHYPFGAGIVCQTVWVDTALLIQEFREFLMDHNLLIQDTLFQQEMLINSDGFRYMAIKAKRVIFCEGFASKQNPLFSFIPFRPVKGELLTLRIPNLGADFIVSKNIFLLPIGNHLFRLGATYDWDDLTGFPTDKGRTYLLQQLAEVLQLPFEVVDHQAGIRPAIADRRPVVGAHPDHSNLYILNGLGAKGVMLAPFLVDQLIDLIEGKGAIDPEIEPGRFIRKSK